LRIELGDSLTGAPLRRGGYGDVWKREYQGQTVAVKVLRVYEESDLQKLIRVSNMVLLLKIFFCRGPNLTKHSDFARNS